MGAVKRVAVIGAGPSGAIAVDALAKEKAFDVIKVFERREAVGGCWIGDENPPPHLTDLASLSTRTGDPPISIPNAFPTSTPTNLIPRYADSSIYPYLETNVDDLAMSYSQEPIPSDRSAASVALHGADTPFRHWTVMRDYVRSLFARNGYEDLISFGTSVERAYKKDDKASDEWELVLRRESTKQDGQDEWWVEHFDAVVVASGHFSVPFVPFIEGLAEFEADRPGSVRHSKNFRGREDYRGKRVVVVGASVSAADIAFDLTKTASAPVHAVVDGRNANIYFGDEAFNHPLIARHPTISRIDAPTRTVHFIDGTSLRDVDALLFGTGYSWSLPFLPQVEVRNNRVPLLYQHVVYRPDPTLLFVGAVGAGLTFKIFEWQAVLAARLLAGRARLPPVEEQRLWEEKRVEEMGDGGKFMLVHPRFEEYFETVRALAGPGEEGLGRQLPEYREEWFRAFMDGHERRKAMWKRINEQARLNLENGGDGRVNASLADEEPRSDDKNVVVSGVAAAEDEGQVDSKQVSVAVKA